MWLEVGRSLLRNPLGDGTNPMKLVLESTLLVGVILGELTLVAASKLICNLAVLSGELFSGDETLKEALTPVVIFF
jgi:hypothetical protein